MKFDVNQSGQKTATFNGTLLSISDKTFANTNGKNYKVGTVSYVTATGEVKQSTAIIYEGNYKNGMRPNVEYLCTATQTDEGVIINVSHLTASTRANINDFFAETEVATLAGVTNGEA
jgi:hypothetical protein